VTNGSQLSPFPFGAGKTGGVRSHITTGGLVNIGGSTDRQLQQAAKPVIGSISMSESQPPQLTGPSGVVGSTPATGGTNGATGPMMPGMGAAGAAAGLGVGDDSSRARRRRRTETNVVDGVEVAPVGPAPGVPTGLRGRSARPEDGDFQPFLPLLLNKLPKQNKDDGLKTLQLLDEELWAVDGPSADQVVKPHTAAK
jgi:hypothetical protein